MTDHFAKAKKYRDLAMRTVELAQLESNDTAQSSLYGIAEGYLSLAELELKAADQQQSTEPTTSTKTSKKPRSPRKSERQG
jgi:hypothetical protein